MADEEGLNLPCPFAGQKRADRIDQPAPGTDQLGTDIEQPQLACDQAVQPLGREAPTTLRIAPPRAAARAWRIDQDEIGLCAPVGELRELIRRVEKPHFDACAGAAGPR